jgi:nucleoside-diphosphate-sugar epimerase
VRTLVTGAQGFVGRYFAALALAEDPSAVVLGVGRSPRDDAVFTHRVRWGSAAVLAPVPPDLRARFAAGRYDYRAVDLRDRNAFAAVVREFAPDVVVHMASGLRDDDPAHLFGTNVVGALALVEAIAETAPDIERVVMGSTGGVYGAPQDGGLPLAETARCEPVDLYSASKLASEHATRIAAQRTGVPLVWARLFNLVGPGQDERHVVGRFAAQAAAISRGLIRPVLEVGNLDATRDFIDVRDIASGVLQLAASGEPGLAYNVGSGVETRIRDVLDETLRAAGVREKTTIELLPPRAGDIPRHFADIGRMRRLGFKTRYAIEQSIADVVEYYVREVARAAGG